MSVALTTRELTPAEELVNAPAAVDFPSHRELQARCQQAGVYFHPDPVEAWFLSTAHTPEDIDTVCETIGVALASMPDPGLTPLSEGEI
jgi:glutamate-1-semialdehyde 2,1-aminomutase